MLQLAQRSGELPPPDTRTKQNKMPQASQDLHQRSRAALDALDHALALFDDQHSFIGSIDAQDIRDRLIQAQRSAQSASALSRSHLRSARQDDRS